MIQYEKDSTVPETIIRNIFIKGPVYEVTLDDDNINVSAYNTAGDAYGAEYTPYPTSIKSMDFKRYRTGSIVPYVIEIEMDHGWAITARVTLLQNRSIRNRVQVAFSLCSIPRKKTYFIVQNNNDN